MKASALNAPWSNDQICRRVPSRYGGGCWRRRGAGGHGYHCLAAVNA